MDTYFAPAGKKSVTALAHDINFIVNNPIIDIMLESVNGLFVVLNDTRQVVAINDYFLEFLGIEDIESVLGCRLGEVIKCENAAAPPNGCGTTKKCQSCGAVIAMMSCLQHKETCENRCIVKRADSGVWSDLVFKVKASPFVFYDRTYIMMFLQDATQEQELAVLEKTFFHDINNTISGLLCTSELIADGMADSQLVDIIRQSIVRLKKEIEMQSCVKENLSEEYKLYCEKTSIEAVISELEDLIKYSFSESGVELEIDCTCGSLVFYTDISLVLRVLTNIAINAMEASERGDTVNISVSHNDSYISFLVKNRGVIPEQVAERIFQKNYTTKNGNGHGLGTFSMKFFGEKILKGKVSFNSSAENGTVFRFDIPL